MLDQAAVEAAAKLDPLAAGLAGCIPLGIELIEVAAELLLHVEGVEGAVLGEHGRPLFT